MIGRIIGNLSGLGGHFAQSEANQQRLRAILEQRASQQSSFSAQMSRRQADDYIDAEFTVLDDQPQIEQAKLLEDKR